MFYVLKIIPLMLGAAVVLSLSTDAAAEDISVTTTFSCDSQEDCKAKCEALGRGHVWRGTPNGPTLGTCTKRSAVARPSMDTLRALNSISENSSAIEEELNDRLRQSSTMRELGIADAEISSFAIRLKRQKPEEPICATCSGSGIAVERCCQANDPICVDPCWDGMPILAITADQ